MKAAAAALALLIFGLPHDAAAGSGHVSMGPQVDSAVSLDPSPGPPPIRRDDKRRTLRSYGSNLAYNLLGVVTPGNRGPLLVTAAFTAPAFAWDQEVIDYLRHHPHMTFGNVGKSMGGGIAVSALTVGLFSAGRIASGDRFRSATYDASQAVIVNLAWNEAIKFTVRRERPNHSNRQAFPSGHASNAFAVAAVVARHYPRFAIPSYAVASFIATSRMAANDHRLSDVVAGAGFGYGVGRLVVRRNGRPPRPAGASHTTSLQLDRGPSRDGWGGQAAIVF